MAAEFLFKKAKILPHLTLFWVKKQILLLC